MSNPFLPEGTDLRDVEGHRPVHRSPNAGISAGSISVEMRTPEEIERDRLRDEAERAEHRAELARMMTFIERQYR